MFSRIESTFGRFLADFKRDFSRDFASKTRNSSTISRWQKEHVMHAFVLTNVGTKL